MAKCPAARSALIALVSSGLHGTGVFNLYMPAIFCQALLGLAVARSIAGFEPLAVWAAWRQGTHVWRTLVLALGTALLAAVVGVLLGTVGISIARQLFHETYDMRATTEAGQALTLSKWQRFFYFFVGRRHRRRDNLSARRPLPALTLDAAPLPIRYAEQSVDDEPRRLEPAQTRRRCRSSGLGSDPNAPHALRLSTGRRAVK